MDKKILQQIIISNQGRIKEIKLIKREITLEKNANYVVIGPRRAGKTYLLYDIIQSTYDNDSIR